MLEVPAIEGDLFDIICREYLVQTISNKIIIYGLAINSMQTTLCRPDIVWHAIQTRLLAQAIFRQPELWVNMPSTIGLAQQYHGIFTQSSGCLKMACARS